MTDENYTHIVLVVDRSGSMYTIADDMDGAIHTLLTDQSQVPGRLLVDIVTFDTEVEYPYSDATAADITGGIIHPRGGTALNDAVGKTIVKFGEKLDKMPEDEKPGHVIFVVVTDGQENASREYALARVKDLVTRQTNDYGWVFIYLAANVDAFGTGEGYGFSKASTMSYAPTAAGTKSSLASVGRTITDTRSGLDAAFTEAERLAAEGS